jgi:6-phosphogluconolactonase
VPDVRLFPDMAALARSAAGAIAVQIGSGLGERENFRLALTGGSTPRPVYERLAETRGIDWGRVELYWGDERCVPPDHEASNFRLAEESLLSRVPVPPERVHRMEGELAPEEAARRYQEALGDEPLDLVLLGMGDDGHVASLFPGCPEADEREARVVVARGPKPPAERVSLTMRAINEARAVYFMVAGSGKADRVAEIFREIESGAPRLPAAMVSPRGGEPVWFLDEAAAGKVSTS